jgi:hypothetical protein
MSTAAFAQIGISVNIAPPELPVYDQPACPGDGYIWTPRYWAWDGSYYWVPGTWALAPEAGYLWTPGYWGWGNGGYFFNQGYWGESVGFYGGVDYGYGYFGHGYGGGRWEHNHFFYNTSVNNMNGSNIRNVYNTRLDEQSGNRVSFNGGTGGIDVRATAEEEKAGGERHIAPVAAQSQHAYMARNEPQQRFTANHGAPAVGATSRPRPAVHPKDLAPIERGAPVQSGNAKRDQKYQKQQEDLANKQNQDRQKLQQRQDQQHQQLAKQSANQAKSQQLEQQHQQQTNRQQEQHVQQSQHLEQRQGGGGGSARGGGGGARH